MVMTRHSQKDAVLAALKGGPKSTWQLGYGLGICCVTKRISEIREEYGYDSILTTKEKRNGKWVFTYTWEGKHEIQTPANKQGRATENGAQAVQAEHGIEAPDAHPAGIEGMAQAARLGLTPCVPVRSQGIFTRWCDGCKKPFQSVYARKRFCSDTCRTRDWKEKHPPTGTNTASIGNPQPCASLFGDL